MVGWSVPGLFGAPCGRLRRPQAPRGILARAQTRHHMARRKTVKTEVGREILSRSTNALTKRERNSTEVKWKHPKEIRALVRHSRSEKHRISVHSG